MRRTIVLVVCGLGLLAVAATTLLTQDGDPDVRLRLENANGLRGGSQVKIGGAVVGRVDRLSVEDGQVRADLDVDPGTRLGRDARFAISTANLLGAKFVAVEPGDTSRPLEPGAVVPSSRVTVATDLDQVVDVLDADTRTRLAILINELGIAVTGREQDLRGALAELPPSVVATTRLLDSLVADNRTLARTIADTDRAVSALAPERRRIVRALDDVGRLSEHVAARRAELRETLRRTPATLRSARGFLEDLRRTTVPLGPAARDISAVAPSLRTTLREVDGFAPEVTPTLRAARRAAPQLTELAARATPVVRRAVPTVRALHDLFRRSPAFSRTLDASVPDLLGLIEGWSRTIQTRDGLSHTFRARALISADIIESLARQLAPPAEKAPRRAKRGPKRATRPAPAPAPPRTAPAPTRPAPSPAPLLPDVGGLVGGLLDTLDRGAAAPAPKPGSDAPNPLLDFLLRP
jgi:phospholipid/cholesterol/gamma-HCH transport system substrate-binding protein